MNLPKDSVRVEFIKKKILFMPVYVRTTSRDSRLGFDDFETVKNKDQDHIRVVIAYVFRRFGFCRGGFKLRRR